MVNASPTTRTSAQTEGPLDFNSPELRALVETIAWRNKPGLRQLANQYGYVLGLDDDAVAFCYFFLSRHQGAGFDELVRKHPDVELILEICGHPDVPLSLESGFSGPPAPSAVIEQLAALAVHGTEELRQVLNAYGARLSPQTDELTVGRAALRMLQRGNEALEHQIEDLMRSAWSGFAIEAVAGAIGQIAGVVSTTTARKAAQEQQRADLTMAILASKAQRDNVALQGVSLGQQAYLTQLEHDAATRRQLLTLGGVVLVLLLALGAFLLIRR